jgi:hypothetical protein
MIVCLSAIAILVIAVENTELAGVDVLWFRVHSPLGFCVVAVCIIAMAAGGSFWVSIRRSVQGVGRRGQTTVQLRSQISSFVGTGPDIPSPAVMSSCCRGNAEERSHVTAMIRAGIIKLTGGRRVSRFTARRRMMTVLSRGEPPLEE